MAAAARDPSPAVEVTLLDASLLPSLSAGPATIKLLLATSDLHRHQPDDRLRVTFVPDPGQAAVTLTPDALPLRSGEVAIAATSPTPSDRPHAGRLVFRVELATPGSVDEPPPPPIAVVFAGLEEIRIDETLVRPEDGTTVARQRAVQFVAPEVAGAETMWDFGDGATGLGPQVEHSYSTNGPREVVLRISRPGAVTSTIRRSILVQDVQISIEVEQDDPRAEEEVVLTTRTAGPVREIRWFVEDQPMLAARDGSLTHRFDTPGEIEVRVLAVSDVGDYETSRSIRIGPARPKPEPEPIMPEATGVSEVIDVGGGVDMHLRLVAAGLFEMGSPEGSGRDDERPQRDVVISRPFMIGRTEVTRAQWRAVMGPDRGVDESSPHLPVTGVSWEDAVEFCEALSRKLGRQFRLPTEAEWEFACRAGTATTFSFGEDGRRFADFMWSTSNSDGAAHRVALKRGNAWDLHDMHGNVWEWCADWYGADSYADGTTRDPQGPASGSSRVLRGGSWSSPVNLCRSSNRLSGGRAPSSTVGFRVVAAP